MHVCLCFLYRVKVAFTGKTMAVVVKSNKMLQDALAAMLNKYRLRPQDATVTMVSAGLEPLEHMLYFVLC